MKEFSPELSPLLGVVAASVSEAGVLEQANAGFLRLLGDGTGVLGSTLVARYFIQPDFASLLQLPAPLTGDLYTGLLTLGDFAGKTRTLKARLWRAHGQLHVLAEFDITD